MILRLDRRQWGASASAPSSHEGDSTAQLEAGALLLMPELAFDVHPAERVHFSPSIAAAKNVSFDPSRKGKRVVSGFSRMARENGGGVMELVSAMLRRFSDSAEAVVDALFPRYRGRLERARASFRPAEIAGRKTSWRQDDTRLHIDAFPATPVQGRRILRLFTNVNPEGRPRSWRLGEPFEELAQRFGGDLRVPRPFRLELLRLTGITKSRRSAYDALMLQLHDRMKADLAYQARVPRTPIDFPAGSTWIAFTDQVSHAAVAGQYQLEQTFLLPVEAMQGPERSPLRILERMKGRRLA
jgi:hypothetical protein